MAAAVVAVLVFAAGTAQGYLERYMAWRSSGDRR
jgi:hypothetical protein